jgi:hypothetical protein
MLAETFSHGLIRDFVVAFGTLFNNIKINRRASSGEDSNTIAIPLSYAPQQRYIERITQDLTLDRPVAISLPRMSFEMVSMNYAPDRKLNTMQKYHGRRVDTSNTQIASTYSPVPYDFNFQLSVYIANIEDGTHIIEQILPYFTPEFTVSLRSVTELGMNMDIPLVLNSVNMEDSYEGGFDERRIIIWTLDFTMKGQLFGPVSNSGIINKIKVNLRPTMNAAIDTREQIYITPGQFSNGLATNVAALSVDPTLIAANSDYGISQQIFNMHQDADTFRLWDFLHEGPLTMVKEFGLNSGNNTFDGWSTFEASERKANGEVALSHSMSYGLRHNTKKTSNDLGAYNENLYLEAFANATPDPIFDQFYGKNYQNVSMKFRIKDTDKSGATSFNWLGKLRWLTTNTNEDIFTDNTLNRYKTISAPSAYTSSSLDTLSQDWQTVNWSLRSNAEWDDRIITGLRFELFTISDENSSMEVNTDIEYIKISANTTVE